ncbi:lasso peptide isopeptide bond-forming cyclase [Amycolatopsis sp. WAC 01375]|uniref:lasso peptide isopeptide bond-forming cyclase n=1 Tax=Amycolatopsis sp. WAC 01375 TaxID=2203194 RepID=UPI000F7AAD36|nr:lasso peptide isopeptide bond-forming cyclase [Amycolatopsis sp. WAC 01375]RSM78405.1 lasso peptide isopeptide bond-forming cyclase [Amycolatopsis sp. WAC 01375]
MRQVVDTLGHGEEYFAVFPDHEAALAVAPRLHAPGSRTLAHASGRPWLTGRWPDDGIVVASAGRTRLAVIGWCPVTEKELTIAAARLRDPGGLGALAAKLPGSFHLVASVDGHCRVQGTASGLRLVHHTRIGGVVVAADRADILAHAAGADIDERMLAVRLLFPVPHPLLHKPMWRGVHGVEPGSALVLTPDGLAARTVRWWDPPRPERSLAEGAPLVREALTAAVDARTAAGGVVACDLSGGLDSTSVTFLAARGDAKIVASTWPGLDPADDDLTWATRAAAHLPEVEHVVWDVAASPLVYAGLLEIDDPLDEPTIGMMDRARLLSDLAPLAAKGSRVRLTGIGGDHVAWCSEAHYHTILRRRPLFALGALRGFRALFTWPLGGMVRALADSRSYRRWLSDAAADVRAPKTAPVTAALGWSTPPRLFDWVTLEAKELASVAIRDAALTAEPLGRTRGEHADLEQILSCTRIIRQWEQMSARAGLPIQSPFLDDRVIEACLSIRPDDRVTPWAYKPVLTEAMRGVVPGECLARTSKAQASMDAAAGLRACRGDLRELWADPRLAELGLVDRNRLGALASRPDTPELRDSILYPTIGCEVWLRTFSKPLLSLEEK